jgi:hypothetical protein
MAVLAVPFALGYAIHTGRIEVPEAYNPWAPLNVAAAPNGLTRFKLDRAKREPDRCLAALTQAQISYEVLPDRVTGPGCGFSNALRLQRVRVHLGEAVSLSCPMALSLAMWERHALQPASQQHMGQGVRKIEHVGSYACRNINRGEGAAPQAPQTSARGRSRHATANAFDITGFELDNGKRVSVLKHWNSAGTKDASPTPEALLLDELHSSACRYFDGVLGPAYNAVHRDHFHLETGGFSMCR